MLKAIIVDDDINVRNCLRQLIHWEEIGYTLAGEASNGLDGFNLAVELNPDVIITDIRMPSMDGSELSKKVREVMSDVCLVFLSAYENFTIAQMALKYNVKEYVLKPIDDAKIDYITNILEEHRETVEKKKYLEHIITDADFGKEISFHLKGSDNSYFTELFSKISECVMVDLTMFSTVCFKLIQLLYDYMLEIGVSTEIVAKKKTHLDVDLSNFKNQYNMLEYTKKLFMDVLQFDSNMNDNTYSMLINSIKNEIENNYSDSQLNIATLAKKFYFTSDYLGSIFKQHTGTTITAYIHEVRLAKAEDMLANTEKSMNDISSLVGYTSRDYFTRAFRQKNNMSPSSYRIKFVLQKNRRS